jgi:hypothetical protein
MRRLVAVAWVACGGLMVAAPGQAATRLVPAGGDLQAALDAARPGDAIVLPAGATFTGNFLLPARRPPDDDDRFVTVQSSGAGDLPPGRRVTPASGARLATLRSPNTMPALRTAPAAHHWRLVGLELAARQDGASDIVCLGDGSEAQRDLASVAHDLVLDRCYVHGAPDTRQKRGIALNGRAVSILNCWIDEIKQTGQDSQAIAGWNGPGPFTIVNNYLSAAGQGFMLGGSDPSIAGLVPADVLFAGNHVTRPTAWRAARWQVKNLLELKNARDVTIEDNLFEHNWRGAQSGYAIVFTPRNQGGQAPWSTVEHVRFRRNVVRHVAAAVSIMGRDHPNPSGTLRDVAIEQNLFYDVDGAAWGGGNGEFLLLGDQPSGVVVERNTILQTGNIVSVYGGSAARPAPIAGFVFRGNLVRHNAYGVHGDDRGVGNDTLSAYFPGAVFTGNVLAGGSASAYPGGNRFPDAADFDGWFVGPAQDDFHVKASRASATAAAGADIDRIDTVSRAALDGTYAPAVGAARQG